MFLTKEKLIKILEKYSVRIFFLVYLAMGIALFRSYGISVDEPLERVNGVVSLIEVGKTFDLLTIKKNEFLNRYVKTRFEAAKLPLEYKDHDLAKYRDRFYPVAFTLPAMALERLFNLNEERQTYLFRHLLNFLVCALGVFALYRLAERRFSDWRIGLLAALFLILSPRFFAESFYNSKDLVLMAFFAIVMNTMIGFLVKPSWRSLLWHALASGLAMDVRLMAIVFPLGTTILVAIKILRRELEWKKALAYLAVYFCFLALFLFCTWPYLWEDPFGRLSQAFVYMAKLDFPVASLYLGHIYPSTQLPWHYLPVWISITTPLLYLALFFIGAVATLKAVVLRHWRLWNTNEELQDLIFLVICVVPVLAVVLLRSVLYDGWRHMYFIYPAFLMVAMKGWFLIWTWAKSKELTKYLAALVITVSLANTAFWMIKAHPLQNVYFNPLAGKNWKENFDVDYWGLANRQALEYILEHDDRSVIRVWAASFTPLFLKQLFSEQSNRIVAVSKVESADYILTNYRSDFIDHLRDAKTHLFHQVKIDDEVIISLYKKDQEATSLSVHSGDKFYFGLTQNGLPYLVEESVSADRAHYGWSNPEGWGVWSDGVSARIYFPHLDQKTEEVVLRVKAFISPLHPVQRVNICIIGSDCKPFVFSTNDSQIIRIHLDQPKRRRDLALEFEFLSAVTPLSLGISDDVRLLSIGLESIQLY